MFAEHAIAEEEMYPAQAGYTFGTSFSFASGFKRHLTRLDRVILSWWVVTGLIHIIAEGQAAKLTPTVLHVTTSRIPIPSSGLSCPQSFFRPFKCLHISVLSRTLQVASLKAIQYMNSAAIHLPTAHTLLSAKQHATFHRHVLRCA